MRTFFEQLANKLAERWVGLLALPGALFALTAWLACQLGQAHALSWSAVSDRAAATVAALGKLSVGTQAVLVIVALLAVTGIGLVVPALAVLTRYCWFGRWPRVLAAPLVRGRRARWHRLVGQRHRLQDDHPADTRTAEDQDRINHAADRINRLALAEPGRATWMGDRVHAVERVALDRYGLDLAFGWPRLWVLLPEVTRTTITAAGSAFTSAVVVATWGVPYLLLGIVWWPSAVAGFAVGVVGWARARPAVDELAALSEAAIDLHGRALAVALGVAGADSSGPLDIEEGRRITRLVRKGR